MDCHRGRHTTRQFVMNWRLSAGRCGRLLLLAGHSGSLGGLRRVQSVPMCRSLLGKENPHHPQRGGSQGEPCECACLLQKVHGAGTRHTHCRPKVRRYGCIFDEGERTPCVAELLLRDGRIVTQTIQYALGFLREVEKWRL